MFDWLLGSRVPPPAPVPEEWRSFLWEYSSHYRRLPAAAEGPFEDAVQRFIATQRITGVHVDVDDRLRLLVAASAVTLALGWPGYKWSELAEVLLYPDSFDPDYSIGPRELAGVAHVWGTIILSVPSLWRSFEYYEDQYHVGLHEFAHLLTFERGTNIRIPVGLRGRRIELWEKIQARELKRIRNGESVVEMLAEPTEVEFFPCVVEAFFQKPIELSEKHRRLYRFLRQYFDQDPAGWEMSKGPSA